MNGLKRIIAIAILVGAALWVTEGCKSKGGKQEEASQKAVSDTAQKVSPSEERNDVFSWDFEDVPIGELPHGWVIGVTGTGRPLPTWQVVEDTTAPNGSKVLAMLHPNHRSAGTFNLCWTDSVPFKDGEIEVKLKALTGRIDQGGGIMWRVQDNDNYYVARFNPLEDNFRMYYVKDGHRKMLATANVKLPADQWHTLKIVQRGNRFECYLNGQKLLEGTDDHFPMQGGVGLWTKADAVTEFEGFTVKLEVVKSDISEANQ